MKILILSFIQVPVPFSSESMRDTGRLGGGSAGVGVLGGMGTKGAFARVKKQQMKNSNARYGATMCKKT